MWQSNTVNEVLAGVTDWYTIEEVAEQLGISVGKVRRLIQEHQIFGVRRDGQIMVPQEIIINGEPLASLHGTLVVLLDSGFTIESAINWLYTYDESLPGTPMEFLLKGHKSAVRRLAMSLAL